MGITIKELSEISGYSCSTISRVISGKKNVKKETREAVEQLLLDYNYRTNVMELRSQSQKNKTILVILTDLEDHWLAIQAKGIQEEASRNGFTALAAFSNGVLEEEENFVKMAIRDRYAGVIILNTCGGKALVELLKQSGIPVVFLNQEIRFSGFDCVITDNYQSGYLLTEYLIKKGHRKIGHLMGEASSLIDQERRRGFEDAMRDHGLYLSQNSTQIGKGTFESGYAIGEQLVKKGLDFTAVFCGTYQMAFGLMNALKDYDVKVPEDLSVVCCDNCFHTEYLDITVVEWMDIKKTGKRAMELLLTKINGDDSGNGSVVYRPKLIERKSVRAVENEKK